LKVCTKCKSTDLRFKVTLEAIVDVIVDENGSVVEELNIEKRGKKFGTRYVCTVCGKEYSKIEPLMAHAR